MSSIKNSIPEGRRKVILDKFAGEIADMVIFDPSIADEELPYILQKIEDEIENFFESIDEY